MNKKILKTLTIVSSAILLASCSTFSNPFSGNKDKNELIKDKYAGVNNTEALQLSSQIYGANDISSNQANKMEQQLLNIRCRTVYFGFDSYELTNDAKKCLDNTAKYLVDYPNQPIKLSGNTDPIGSEKYNFNLGQKRADAVYKYLLSKGVEKSQMCAVSFGKLKPAAEPKQFYNEVCGIQIDNQCIKKASEKAYYLDRRTDLDFGAKCNNTAYF